MKNVPDPKIGVLYQNDDYGKDYLEGLKKGLGDKAKKLIVAELTYEVADPTVDSQIVSLKNSGANVFYNVTTPKFAAMAIRQVYDIGWRPLHLLNHVSASVGTVLKPAGLEKSVGVISALWLKDPTDPQWHNDDDYKFWSEWMDKYHTTGNKASAFNAASMAFSFSMHQVLKMCGDNLTRKNVIKQVTSIKDLEVPMLLPGLRVNTSPTDYYPVEQYQLARFDGKKFVLFGEVMDASAR
jgi:branched-chain amino acid transport system substrate-binding protein